MTIAMNISKALLDITGEPKAEVAILEIMKDAIEHRIEKIKAELKKYEDKYLMAFVFFKDKFEKEEISESYSFKVETDYLEWEALISRLKKYESLLAGMYN